MLDLRQALQTSRAVWQQYVAAIHSAAEAFRSP
jgi:hypothetical protein